jgi:signal transduction histidine kinase
MGMTAQLDLRLLSAYRRASYIASGIVLSVGLLVMLGWLFDIAAFKSIFPTLATMKVNTALAFGLMGISLLLESSQDEKRWIKLFSKGCAAAALLIGLLTLGEYAFRQDFGIDQLLIKVTQTPENAYPGRMSPVTALNISLLGFALLILDRHAYRWPVEALGMGALLISMLAIIGYIYGIPSFYEFFLFSPIAIHTTLAFLILSFGILFARPEQGLMKIFSSADIGGGIARRLVSGAILIPIVLGWLLLTGQRMGLYGPAFSLVLFAVSTVIVFVIMIWWNAGLLQTADLLRQRTQMQLSESQEAGEELQKAKQELEAANQELEAFSYSVSHDLRSPLRSIDGFSQALLEDYGELLPVEGHNFLENIRRSARRMGELIDDLLKLSRVTRAEIRSVQVDLTRLAGNILADLQRTHSERKVQYKVAPNLTEHCDERLLRVVLENLLSNAWKYTSKQEYAEIEFGSKLEDDQTVYFIRDNGAGFNMAYADKLFGAFQRLHTTTEFSGTGIGLATVQRIIHRHSGRIWAQAAVDEGATFFFTLSALQGGQPKLEPKEEDSILKRAEEII